MGRVQTNNTQLTVTSTATGNAYWTELEPNAITTFGSTITTVTRTPIDKSRQRRKGTITDLESSVEFEHDMVEGIATEFVPGFMFTSGYGPEHVQRVGAVAAVANQNYGDYSVAALNADYRDYITNEHGASTLFWAEGFNDRNNGLKTLFTSPAANAVTIRVVGVPQSADTAPVAQQNVDGRLTVAGMRVGDPHTNLSISARTFAGSTANADTSEVIIMRWVGNNAYANSFWTDRMHLRVGQVIVIGADDGAGGIAGGILHQNTVISVLGKVISVTGNQVEIALHSVRRADGTSVSPANNQWGFQVTPANIAEIYILAGTYMKNVDVDDDKYEELIYTFELFTPGLAADGGDMWQYSRENRCNTISVNIPLTDKATVTLGFIGPSTEDPTTVQQASAQNASPIAATRVYNTSTDIARLSIEDVDATGLSTDFKSVTLTLNNNVSGERVLAHLGPRYFNTGIFEVNLEAELLFTNAEVVKRIRENTTVRFDLFLEGPNNGFMLIHIPAMTMGGGGRNFPVNESVTINVTGEAVRDSVTDASLVISFIHGGAPDGLVVDGV